MEDLLVVNDKGRIDAKMLGKSDSIVVRDLAAEYLVVDNSNRDNIKDRDKKDIKIEPD